MRCLVSTYSVLGARAADEPRPLRPGGTGGRLQDVPVSERQTDTDSTGNTHFPNTQGETEKPT
eukprot:COSAG02_NODE_66927_length_254_cov_0.664516_1_plen_63_part_00